jgi:uncharacterized membrane protein
LSQLPNVSDLYFNHELGKYTVSYVAPVLDENKKVIAVLANHFPPGAMKRDELPNKLVEI